MPHSTEDAPVIPYQFWDAPTSKRKQTKLRVAKPFPLSKRSLSRISKHDERIILDRLDSSPDPSAPVFPSFMFSEGTPEPVERLATRPTSHNSSAKNKGKTGPTNLLGVARLRGTKDAARDSRSILGGESHAHRSCSPYPQDSSYGDNRGYEYDVPTPDDYPYSMDCPPPPEAYNQLEVVAADKYRFKYTKDNDETHKPDLPPSRRPPPFGHDLLKEKPEVQDHVLYWKNESMLEGMQRKVRGYAHPSYQARR